MIERLNRAMEGRYRTERELGEGGMATVYLAEDLKHKRKVAIKVLRPELAAVVGAERFLAEIETTANLQHPNILPLFDSGEADGLLFYVMPYVEGESLRERLEREKQLPVDEAVGIAAAVGHALAAAHEEGVIHRDIKPANILLSRGQPAVSPDGNQIALVHSAGSGTPGVWVLDLRDGAFTRITFQGQSSSPFWSPDGREIGFLSDRDGTPAIYSRPVDMSTEARVLRRPSENWDVVWARWTPDGRRLVYNLDYRRIVHAPPHPDSAEVEFAAARGFVLSFAVSPDGKWLAYTSGETGGPEVYIRPFPGPGGQRQISVGGGRGPRWMPDGQSLIYQVDGQDVWVRARLRTGGDFGVVERETYADGGGMYSTGLGTFDLAPDGRVLGVNMGTRLSARGFVVAANWGAEMRALEGR